MICVKTGFRARLWSRDLYGDAFKLEDTFVFRVSSAEFNPPEGKYNFIIENYTRWFNDDPVSTLFVLSSDLTDLGYAGQEIAQ